MTKNNQPSGKADDAKQDQIKPGQSLKPPVDNAKQSEPQNTQGNDLAEREAALAAKEAELAAREKALQQEGEALTEMQANLAASAKDRPQTDFGVGLLESDIDLTGASEEVKRGMDPNATQAQRKAYTGYVREHFKGQTPLKNFLVTVKKGKEIAKQERVKAVDEGDAIRRVLMRSGLAEKSGDYHMHAERVLNAAV